MLKLVATFKNSLGKNHTGASMIPILKDRYRDQGLLQRMTDVKLAKKMAQNFFTQSKPRSTSKRLKRLFFSKSF